MGGDRKNNENGRARLLANIINGFKVRNRSGRGGYVVRSVGAHERNNNNVLVAPLKAVDRVNLRDERNL